MTRSAVSGTAPGGPYSPGIVAEGRFVVRLGPGPIRRRSAAARQHRGRDAADARQRRTRPRGGGSELRRRRALRRLPRRSRRLRGDERRLPDVLPRAAPGPHDDRRRAAERDEDRDRLRGGAAGRVGAGSAVPRSSGVCRVGLVAVHRCCFAVAHPPNRTGQGSIQSLSRSGGTSHGELDLLVDFAGQHQARSSGHTRCGDTYTCAALPYQARAGEYLKTSTAPVKSSIARLGCPRAALRGWAPDPSPPRSPRIRRQAWSYGQQAWQVPIEGNPRLLRRLLRRRQRQCARTRRNPAGHSGPAPTRRHRPREAIVQRRHWRRVVPRSRCPGSSTLRMHGTASRAAP